MTPAHPYRAAESAVAPPPAAPPARSWWARLRCAFGRHAWHCFAATDRLRVHACACGAAKLGRCPASHVRTADGMLTAAQVRAHGPIHACRSTCQRVWYGVAHDVSESPHWSVTVLEWRATGATVAARAAEGERS